VARVLVVEDDARPKRISEFPPRNRARSRVRSLPSSLSAMAFSEVMKVSPSSGEGLHTRNRDHRRAGAATSTGSYSLMFSPSC